MSSDQFSEQLLHHVSEQLESFSQSKRCFVALSGGVDSVVLLHVVSRLRNSVTNFPQLYAIHINHQISPFADYWQKQCELMCNTLQLPLQIERVCLNDHQGSVEMRARAARYQAFERVLDERDLLLLAQHQDDQLETYFLRMLRGAGVKGRAAMPVTRVLKNNVTLYRPLLSIPKQQLLDYARAQQLTWVEDESNQDTTMDRNYLRKMVLPLLAERWPGYRKVITRSCIQAESTQNLLDEIAILDLNKYAVNTRQLSISGIQALSSERRRNLLRYWINGLGLEALSEAQLAQLENLMLATEDAQPRLDINVHAFRRFQDDLYCTKRLLTIDNNANFLWSGKDTLDMDAAGSLNAQRVIGQGLRGQSQFNIVFRQGGERSQPVNRRHSQTLKKLFQEYQVPPWLRDRVPLIYYHDQLVAVADYWVAEGHQASANEEGLHIVWQHPD